MDIVLIYVVIGIISIKLLIWFIQYIKNIDNIENIDNPKIINNHEDKENIINENNIIKEKSNNYDFEKICVESDITIIVDKKTGVNYLFYGGGGHFYGGLTPLLDKNNNPIITES